ncbi:MAG TPA: FAD-dependent monooxygenase, partial [Ktedonobacterales bacterium]|nr:FAD-dependent monooxygenase [Ktedonobacterales bacterium]
MAVVKEAVIAGAGIGGLSAGITLARNGVAVAVYDLAPRAGLEGSGLTISAIGMRAIRDLGLGQRVMALGAGSSETIIADAAGHQLDRIATPPLAGGGLPAMGGIMRATFHELLLETARAEGCRHRVRERDHRTATVRPTCADRTLRRATRRNGTTGRRGRDLLESPRAGISRCTQADAHRAARLARA